VTAETALALPSVAVLLALVASVTVAVGAQLSCTDAARAGARAAARGESPTRVNEVAARLAPSGSEISLTRGGSTVRVRVASTADLPLPGLPSVRIVASAVAEVEDPSGGALP